MLQVKRVVLNRRRNNKLRYSANKIYTSRAELQHTNSKLFITLYTYNKKKSSFENYIRNLITLIKFRKIVVGKKKVYIPNHKNRSLHLLKKIFSISKKWNIAFFKEKSNLFDYSLRTELRKIYFYFYNIPDYNTRQLKKLFKLQKTLFHFTKNIHFNTSLFTSLVLNLRNLGLISLLEKLYNKKIKINLVELKAVHLNSDVFSSAVALKLRDRKNKAVNILRKAVLQMVKLPDLHTLITFDNSTETLNKSNVINNINQQVVSGVRFEASGRLTRRLTAMRAVFKYRYAGSLKNIRSSFNRESSTMIRGYLKANLQHTLINSKTRNGTFGLKGWISSHIMNFSAFFFYIGKIFSLSKFSKLLCVHYASPNRLDLASLQSGVNSFRVKSLQSGINSFTVKIGLLSISFLYEDILSYYHLITSGLDCISSLDFSAKPINSLIRNSYDNWIGLQNNNLSVIRGVVETYVSTRYYTTLTPVSFFSNILQYHSHLVIGHSIQRFVLFFLGSLLLVLAVNIHSIIGFFVTAIDRLNGFVDWVIDRTNTYYDVVSDSWVPKKTNSGPAKIVQPSNTISRDNTSEANNASDGNKDNNNNDKDKQGNTKDSSANTITMVQFLIILEYIIGRIFHLRQNTIQTTAESEWYGAPVVYGRPNTSVTLQHITRYAIAHPDEIEPSLNISLRSILSSDAITRMARNATLRTFFNRVFIGRNLTNALVYSEDVRSLIVQNDLSERGIIQGAFLEILSRLNPERNYSNKPK